MLIAGHAFAALVRENRVIFVSKLTAAKYIYNDIYK